MASQNSKLSSNGDIILVLSRSHPELIAFAKYLATKNARFVLLTNLSITSATYKRLNFITKYIPNIDFKIRKRVIPLNSTNSTIISANFFQDIVYRMAYQFGWKRLQLITLKWQDIRFEHQQQILIERINPSIIVASEAIQMQTKPKKKLVIISFHGDPRFINKIRERAGAMYPEWLETEQILPSFSLSLDLADQIISLSNFSAKGIVAHQKKNIPVRVIPVGPLLLPSTEPLNQIAIDEKLTATYLGRMSLMKGLPSYLKLSNEFSDRMNFNLCGFASQEVMTKIRSQKSDRLQIFPSPNKSELELILAKSDIYISPSYYEGFGIAALEAMAFGCIPICSKNSAINEVLANTDLEKFIFDPFDYISLSSKLRLLLEADNQEIKYYKKLAIDISRNFSYENFSAKLFDFLQETQINES